MGQDLSRSLNAPQLDQLRAHLEANFGEIAAEAAARLTDPVSDHVRGSNLQREADLLDVSKLRGWVHSKWHDPDDLANQMKWLNYGLVVGSRVMASNASHCPVSHWSPHRDYSLIAAVLRPRWS